MPAKKYNKYDLSGEYGVGYTHNTNEKFYFDLDDYEKIKDYCWYVDNANRRLCARDIYKINNGSPIKFHRLILGFPDLSFDVDHIDRDELNNRKENLRICSHQKNKWNSHIRETNTSGFTGVSFNNERNKWVASIMIDGKMIGLKRWNTLEEAVMARLKGELKYFGKEFSPQRHLFEEYNII